MLRFMDVLGWLLPLTLFGGVVFLWQVWQEPWQSPASIAPAPEALVAQTITWTPYYANRYVQQINRPLMIQGRRPPEAVQAPGNDFEDPAWAATRLLGVIASGEQRAVLLQTPQGIRRVVIGETVAGYTLEAVEQGLAAFRRGQHHHLLHLPQRVNP